MAARRIICACMAALAITAGCQNKPASNDSTNGKSQPSSVEIPSSPDGAQPDQAEPDRMDAQADTAQLLARKTANYTQDLEPMLARRATQDEPSEPSNVQWDDPNLAIATQNQVVEPSPTRTAPASPVPSRQQTLYAQPAVMKSNTSGNVTAINDTRANKPTQVSSASPAAAAAAEVKSPLDELKHRYEQRIRDYPRDLGAHLDYQLLQYLLDEPVPHLASLATLPSEDRELLTAMLDGLSNFRNGIRADNNMLLSRKVRPMLNMADRLRSQADLAIPTVALCTRVDGFGVYEPIEPRFVAGREHTFIVYAEVENFASQTTDANMYETKLTQETTLYTESSGLPVAKEKERTLVDLSRNRRHDFFVVKMMKVPATLPIGRYLLKVTIVDQTVSRVAETTIPITIVAG